jgi:hypothetical protein
MQIDQRSVRRIDKLLPAPPPNRSRSAFLHDLDVVARELPWVRIADILNVVFHIFERRYDNKKISFFLQLRLALLMPDCTSRPCSSLDCFALYRASREPFYYGQTGNGNVSV